MFVYENSYVASLPLQTSSLQFPVGNSCKFTSSVTSWLSRDPETRVTYLWFHVLGGGWWRIGPLSRWETRKWYTAFCFPGDACASKTTERSKIHANDVRCKENIVKLGDDVVVGGLCCIGVPTKRKFFSNYFFSSSSCKKHFSKDLMNFCIL